MSKNWYNIHDSVRCYFKVRGKKDDGKCHGVGVFELESREVLKAKEEGHLNHKRGLEKLKQIVRTNITYPFREKGALEVILDKKDRALFTRFS